MILGVQYYRPPFPLNKYWQDDLSRIRDAGLQAVQLWACWGWIEPAPGVYRFDDYDELIAQAGQRGLGVVISTVAEIHPFWLLREIPDASMLDHMGRVVVSSLRNECNVGLTPGGCTDNPHVTTRMAAFLQAISQRYHAEKHLLAWDCWNETRWAVQADGFVCYCEHTLRAFRAYLAGRYGSLEDLNGVWMRRYSSWDDVMPGKLPGRTYTDLMEFERFLTWRAAQHATFRYQHIKLYDSQHPILAHCGTPSTMFPARREEQALARGNDWELAEALDGFGCSHFPVWEAFQEADFGVRVESIRSAARDKVMWISELQGGSARDGLVARSPVPAAMQQRWIWGGYGRGAKAALFWCWRDEVFGRESSGFGLSGNDGLAPDRLQALATTGALLNTYDRLLDAYKPDEPTVGVLFEASNYYLDWAQYGNESQQASNSVIGYLRGLERIQVPYEVVDAGHLNVLEHLAVLILPWPLVVSPASAQRIFAWVQAGGTLLVESELDAFSPTGFYRDPGDERVFATVLGVRGLGRRPIGQERSITIQFPDETLELRTAGWLEPLLMQDSDTLARMQSGETIMARRTLGLGQVFVLGTFAGLAYKDSRYSGFELFLHKIIKAGNALPALEASFRDGEMLTWRTGLSGNSRLLFITNAGDEQVLTFTAIPGFFGSLAYAEELISHTQVALQHSSAQSALTITIPREACAVIRFNN